MKTKNEIKDSLKSRFFLRTNQEFREGSVIDLMNGAISQEIEDAYYEIENSKDPHIYTKLKEENLDRMGYFVNIPRDTDESDENYLYRIMNWTHLKAASNLTAINDTLLNMEYSSNSQYFPGVYGSGTGIIYVIPTTYDEETIDKALKEAKEKLNDVIDPAAYVEYLTPEIKPVKFLIQIYSAAGDIDYIKSVAESEIRKYVNAIPPKEYMKIGEISKIGLAIDNMDYFNVAVTYIDNDSHTDIQFLQGIETKFIFDEIVWEEISSD